MSGDDRASAYRYASGRPPAYPADGDSLMVEEEQPDHDGSTLPPTLLARVGKIARKYSAIDAATHGQHQRKVEMVLFG